MKRAVLYMRVGNPDQHSETRLHNFSRSGGKSRRLGLDAMMADARRRKFDIVLV